MSRPTRHRCLAALPLFAFLLASCCRDSAQANAEASGSPSWFPPGVVIDLGRFFDHSTVQREAEVPNRSPHTWTVGAPVPKGTPGLSFEVLTPVVPPGEVLRLRAAAEGRHWRSRTRRFQGWIPLEAHDEVGRHVLRGFLPITVEGRSNPGVWIEPAAPVGQPLAGGGIQAAGCLNLAMGGLGPAVLPEGLKHVRVEAVGPNDGFAEAPPEVIAAKPDGPIATWPIVFWTAGDRDRGTCVVRLRIELPGSTRSIDVPIQVAGLTRAPKVDGLPVLETAGVSRLPAGWPDASWGTGLRRASRIPGSSAP